MPKAIHRKYEYFCKDMYIIPTYMEFKPFNGITLEYRIVVGLRLFINQIFFENVDEKKIKK